MQLKSPVLVRQVIYLFIYFHQRMYAMSVTIISFSLLSSPPKEMLACLVPMIYFHEEMQLPLLKFL